MKFNSFCAANSGDGFVSLFDSIIDEKENKVYYIKGGPGSGKSTFLHSLAERSEDAELIYCSGDPSSLDGVILPKQKAVVIDATAPHCHEPRFPGIGGEIIDLGVIWKSELIDKDHIIHLCNQKSELYHNCYHLLKSIKSIHNGVFLPLQNTPSFDDKIQKISDKILKQFALWEKQPKQSKIQKRFLSAITSDGLITFNDTLDRLGKNIIVLDDRWMIGGAMLNYLDRALTQRGIDHLNAYHPLLGADVLQHIIIPSASLSIRTQDGLFPIEYNDENVVRTVTIQGYLNKELISGRRNKLLFIKRLIKELLKQSIEQLTEIRNKHFEIEATYSVGAVYEAADAIREKFTNKIFP